VWTVAWVVAQAHPSRPSPLDIVGGVAAWAGVPTGWLDAAGEWFDDATRHGVLVAVAIAAGLLWAASTERAQRPAVSGWLALLAAAEGIGYQPAVYLAVATMVLFVLALALIALPARARFPADRVTLIPKDVVRAGVTAAALAAMIPVLAPGLVVVRLLRPYVTRPPRRVGDAAPVPRAEAKAPRAKHDDADERVERTPA